MHHTYIYRHTYVYINHICVYTHKSACDSIRQQTSAYVSIRQHTHMCTYTTNVYIRHVTPAIVAAPTVSIHQRNTSAYVSIPQHTSAYVSTRQHTSANVSTRQHTSAYVSIRQHTSAYVSIRQHTSAYVSMRQHTSAYLTLRQPS
jgi:hypothetical protein